MSGLWLVSYIALWILFLVVAVVQLSVLRNLGTIYETLQQQQHGSPPEPIKLVAGQPVAELRLQHISGEPATLATFRGQPTAFAVISPGCGPCHDLLGALNRGVALEQNGLDARQRVVISVGSGEQTAELVQEVGLPPSVPVLIDLDHSVRDQWGIHNTPTTVIADEQLVFVRHVVGFTAPTTKDSALTASR